MVASGSASPRIEGKAGPPQIRAYVLALEPTQQQIAALQSHCGAQRFAFNWGLALVKANLAQREAERSYGVADSALTPPLNWSAYALRKRWNQAKTDIAPWWPENSKEAYASGLAHLAAALNNWSAAKGQPGRKRIRFPRFKSKRSKQSCLFTTGAIGLVRTDYRHIKLPRVGVIRTLESTRKLARLLHHKDARIRSATVGYRRGRWFVSFSVEVTAALRAPSGQPVRTIGVDLGLRHLAILSSPVPGISDANGFVAAPHFLERTQKTLRRLQRRAARQQGPDRQSDRGPSKRWQSTRAELARVHTRIANCRADHLHKLTTGLVRECDSIVIEDLNVSGLLRNRRLARHISDAGWSELRRQLRYKTSWTGTTLVVANRFYPSSKTCSRCGAVKTKLRLSDRLYQCEQCNLTLDRDVNAARNLAAIVVDHESRQSSASCVGTQKKPAGNLDKTGTTPASGTATGRPPRSTPRSDTSAAERQRFEPLCAVSGRPGDVAHCEYAYGAGGVC